MTSKQRRARDEVDEAIDVLMRFRRALPELDRRTRYAAGGDGYPSSSFGSSGQRGAVSTPTEQAALSGPAHDPVRLWTRDALRSLTKIASLARDIDNALGLALAGGEPVSLTSCEECGREAGSLRRGLCDACRKRAERRRAATS